MLQRRRSSFLMAIVATTATSTLLLLGRAASTTTAFVLRPPRPSSLLPAFLPPSSPTTTTTRGVRTRSGSAPGTGGGSLANSIRLAWGKVLGSALAEEVDPGEVEGTDLRVLKYPDPRLRAPNAEVTEFGPEVAALAKDMFKVMYAMNGVGLAAPQVGVNQRLMVFNPMGDKVKWLNEVVLCNPVIVESSAKTEVAEEGCLSFPGMNGDVERSLVIKVTFQNTKGKTATKKFRDWEARIFQHEYDHLDGVVYIDRLLPESREKVQPVLDKLVADFGPGGAL